MATKHTPGPWETVDLRHQKNGQIRIWSHAVQRGESPHIANVLAKGSSYPDADAKLIAAAPTMVEALRYFDENTEHEPEGCGDTDRPGEDGLVLCLKCVALNALRKAGVLP